MERRGTLRALTVVLMIGGVLAGCGSNAPTPAQFARQLDSVCRSTLKQALVQPKGREHRQVGPQLVAERLAVATRRAADRFEKLKAPGSLDASFTEYKAELKGFSVYVEHYRAALASHSVQALAALAPEAARHQQALTAFARKLSLRDCA